LFVCLIIILFGLVVDPRINDYGEASVYFGCTLCVDLFLL
jgi:hypothetical protein